MAATAAAAAGAASLPSSSTLYSSFSELGVPAPLVSRLHALGIRAPSLIQQRVIPFLQRYEHTGVLVQAPTGTGKSLAFLLPLLAKLDLTPGGARTIQAVIMCPTQELALQTHAQLHALLAVPGSPAPPPLGVGAQSTVALCVGGFHSVDEQRAHLLEHTPAIVVGTPRRLNSIFFPQYETHGTWQQKRRADQQREGEASVEAQLSRRARPQEVIADPPEDDEPVRSAKDEFAGVEGWLDPNDWPAEELQLDEDEWEDEDEVTTGNGGPGRGESHKAPDFVATRAARNAAARAEYEQRNNVAQAAGVSRSAQAAHDAEDAELDEDEDDPSLDGVDDLFLPPRHAVGWEGQKFLLMRSEIARARVASPLKRVFKDVRYLVLDEADQVLQPLPKYAGKRHRMNRQVHPKASNIFVRGLTLLNPTVQLVAASATINAPFRQLLRRLGFRRPKPVHIRIAARGTPDAQAAHVASDGGQQKDANAQLTEGAPASQSQSSGATPTADPFAGSSALSSPGASSVNSYTSSSRAVGVPLSQALMYNLECPSNLSHFYTLAPAFNTWRLGLQHEQPSFPRKVRYDATASAEARQAVHEHNLTVTQQLRRNAFVLDKLASLALLLHQFRPRGALLVVDDCVTATGAGAYKLGDVADMLGALGVRATLLFHHLSNADLSARAAFFRDVAASKFDVLIVSLDSVRGLDLPMCDLVVALEPIRDPAASLHAAGRTGRMGRPGSVVTLLHPEQLAAFDQLTRYMPQTLGDAQQILLPSAVPTEMRKRILDEYARLKPQRDAIAKEMNREIDAKMRKRVRAGETMFTHRRETPASSPPSQPQQQQQQPEE